MQINRQGSHRVTILTKNYAIKLPNFPLGWRLFLIGLLSNIEEASFYDGESELCPTLHALPGGFMNIMPRLTTLTREEFMSLDIDTFSNNKDIQQKLDPKPNNFGWYRGRIVLIDYGVRING